jgi:hypothetical protein
MGFRFRKTIKVARGVRLNISKSGVSTSVGTRGASMTFGHGKRRTTVGLPGTGFSHTTVHSTDGSSPLRVVLLIAAALFILYFMF